MNKPKFLHMALGGKMVVSKYKGRDQRVPKRKQNKPTKNQLYHWSRKARRDAL